MGDQLKITPEGYIETNYTTFETGAKGVYACDDIQEQRYQQFIIAVGSGTKVSLSVI